MSQQEYWANVYREGGESWCGNLHLEKRFAEEVRGPSKDAVLVVHIRLKPEGAPRRYASEHDRRNWETFPEEMRKCPF